MSTIALVGAGRMGAALLKGWLDAGMAARDILIIQPRPTQAAVDAAKEGAICVESLSIETAHDLEMLVLAIKPQIYDAVAPALAAVLPRQTTVLSVLAGTTQAKLSAVFGPRPLIRAMPNTPCAIGQGITGYYPNSQVSAQMCRQAEALLSAGGEVIRVDEEAMIDVVTGVSGSGPAYVFHMVEALQAAAENQGMPTDLAQKLACQTLIGSAALLASSGEIAANLRRAVTSPNGTTQAGLEVLMGNGGLTTLMRDTVTAATLRSKELGKH